MFKELDEILANNHNGLLDDLIYIITTKKNCKYSLTTIIHKFINSFLVNDEIDGIYYI